MTEARDVAVEEDALDLPVGDEQRERGGGRSVASEDDGGFSVEHLLVVTASEGKVDDFATGPTGRTQHENSHAP